MPTNAQDVAKYLEFSLLQLGAESYLHDKNFANQGDVVTAWKFGFNDASHEFIQRQAGEDVFVHFRAIRGDGHRTLRDGQKVEFTVVKGQKGFQAEDVRAID